MHGFEANPEIHQAFSDKPRSSSIGWHNLAVVAEPGPVEIFIPRLLSKAYVDGYIVDAEIQEAPNTGKGSVLKRQEDAQYETVQVDGVTLDGFFEERGARSFMLWIDVEGAASEVLAGAEAVLKRTQAIFIEVEGYAFWENQQGVAAVFDTLIAKGFEPVLRDREYGDAQFNVIFLRKDLTKTLDPSALSAFVTLCGAQMSATDALEAALARKQGVRAPRSLGQALLAETPVLVPCFNNPTYAQIMLRQLCTLGLSRIIFVDNASTSAAMRRWLRRAEKQCQVIRLDRNLGPNISIFTPEALALLPRWFCVTDPDLAFNPMLPSDFLAELAALTKQHGVGKAGFALDISHRHALRQERYTIGDTDYQIWEWEEQFWANPVGETAGGDRVFQADIDTTFALYNQDYLDLTNFLNAVRVAGRFTAQHLPWHADPGLPLAEEVEYRATQRFSFYLPRNSD